MASKKRQQTFAKLTREREVQEKRAKKQEKREERKQAAAAARDAEAAGIVLPEADRDEEEAGAEPVAGSA